MGVPYFRNYEPKHSSSSIAYQNWAVIQDHRGIVYVGNSSGLVEYDGVSWKLLVLPDYSAVRSLARDANGRIYIGGQGTFGYLITKPNERCRYHSLVEHLPEEDRQFADVWKTHAAAEGVYFQTYSHLFRWSDGEMKSWRAEGAFHLSFLVNQTLFIRQEETGLLRLAGEELEPVPGGERFAHERIYVMLPFSPRQVLIGTRNQGLLLMDEQGLHPFPTEIDDYLNQSQLYHGTTLTDGTIALATLRGGAVLIDREGRLLHMLDRALGIQDSSVTHVYADHHGGLWLALDRNVSRVEMPASFTVFTAANGLSGAVQSILRHQGRLLVATTQGVYRLTATGETAQWQPVPVFKPVAGIATQSWQLLQVEQGVLAATNDGVFLVRGDEAEEISRDGALSLLRSQRAPDTIYVGNLDGLSTLRLTESGSRWQPGSPIPGIDDQVRTMSEEEDGSLWLGARYQGLLRLHPPAGPEAGWQVEQIEDGLPYGYGRVRVCRIGDRAYFATDRGLLRWDATLSRLEPAPDFGEQFAQRACSVTLLREDGDQDVWIVAGPPIGVGMALHTSDGVYHWHNTPFGKLRQQKVWDVLSEADEVAWLGTSDGLIRYDPSVRQTTTGELHCLIRTVRARQKEGAVFLRAQVFAHHGGPRPKLPYATYELRFEYAAPCPGAESEVEYQYTLEGFDSGWSGWTREVRKEYSRLPEGSYRFQVHARLPGGQESSEASFAFELLPPWYRSWWAYLTYLILFSVSLFSLIRFYVRRATRRERVEAEHQRRVFELKRARRIQRNMLPAEPPQLPFVDIAAVQRTATEVGGDYYDFFPQNDRRLLVAVGDATGHGLGAGLMVAATRTALLTVCASEELPEVAAKVNYVLRRVHLGSHLNMALILLNLQAEPQTGKVQVVAAGGGMAPMYVLRADGMAEEHVVAGVPLGALPEPEYQPVELILQPHDVLILMSDGVAERRSKEQGVFGYEGVMRCLQELGRRYHQWPESFSPDSILDHILSTGDRWADDESFDDDITVVVVKATPVPPTLIPVPG